MRAVAEPLLEEKRIQLVTLRSLHSVCSPRLLRSGSCKHVNARNYEQNVACAPKSPDVLFFPCRGIEVAAYRSSPMTTGARAKQCVDLSRSRENGSVHRLTFAQSGERTLQPLSVYTSCTYLRYLGKFKFLQIFRFLSRVDSHRRRFSGRQSERLND